MDEILKRDVTTSQKKENTNLDSLSKSSKSTQSSLPSAVPAPVTAPTTPPPFVPFHITKVQGQESTYIVEYNLPRQM